MQESKGLRIRRPLFAAQVAPAVDLDLARARHNDGGLFGLRLLRIVAPADRAQAIGRRAGLPDAGEIAAAFARRAITPAVAVGLDIVPLGLFPVALAAVLGDRSERPSERKLLGRNGGRRGQAGAKRQGGAKHRSAKHQRAKRRDRHDHPNRDLPLSAQAAPARSRSRKCTSPTGRASSTTTREVIFAVSCISSAFATSSSGAMVRGVLVMIAVTGRVGSSGRRLRRRSPSVTMPASVPSSFTTMTLPKPLALISAIAACIVAPIATIGRRSPACMTSRTSLSCAPSLPPG